MPTSDSDLSTCNIKNTLVEKMHPSEVSNLDHVLCHLFLFIQNLYNVLFTNKRTLMRYSIIKLQKVITQKAKIYMNR